MNNLSSRMILRKNYVLKRINDAQLKFEAEGYPQYFMDALEEARLLIIDKYGNGVNTNTTIPLMCPNENIIHNVAIKSLYNGSCLVSINSQRRSAIKIAQSSKSEDDIVRYQKIATDCAATKMRENGPTEAQTLASRMMAPLAHEAFLLKHRHNNE